MRRRVERGAGRSAGYDRMTGLPSQKDGRRRGLLAGLVDGFVRLPVGARLFVALLAFMAVLALLVS